MQIEYKVLSAALVQLYLLALQTILFTKHEDNNILKELDVLLTTLRQYL